MRLVSLQRLLTGRKLMHYRETAELPLREALVWLIALHKKSESEDT